MTWWNFGGLLGKDKEENKDDSCLDYGGSWYRKKYKSSLGWSSNKLTDTTTSYSSRSCWSYYNSDDSKVDKHEKEILILLAKAYKAVRDMVVILDFPFQVEIKLSNYDYRAITSKKYRVLYVPSKVVDSKEYSEDEKINILCGLGIHEASHLKYTEYRVYRNYANKIVMGSPKHANTMKYLANLLEDNRVEDKLLSERPGYLNLIEESNNYKYNLFIKSSNFYTSNSDLLKFLLEVIKFIRFPDKVNPEIISTYEKQFIEIQDILKEDHQFTKDSCILGSRLCEKLVSMVSEMGYKEDNLHDYIKHLCPDEESFEVKVGFDDRSNIELLGKEMSDIFKNSTSGKARLYADIISGSVELGEGLDVYFEKPSGVDYLYNKYKYDIIKYVPGIRKLIQGTDKNYDFTIHGCREGMLDTNKLAEAYQGVPQVYIKKGKVSTNKTTVCVLIDQSGSMGGVKEIVAIKSAILLNEALKDLPGVDLYIYGHSADLRINGDTVLYIYREGKKYCPKYSLSSATAHSENRDGTAILETAKRVRKHTQENCIMFILSDGDPTASCYSGYSAVLDVKNKVKEVEKMGFNVIQVSIDTVKEADKMFDNVVCLNYDLSSLPKKLSQVIKKSIVKDKHVTVS